MWERTLKVEQGNPSTVECIYDPTAFYNEWCPCSFCLQVGFKESIDSLKQEIGKIDAREMEEFIAEQSNRVTQ